MRYDPLKIHLERADGPVLAMTYDEIETLLGRKLPNTAYGDSWRQWWANTETHSQALAWLRAGWRVTRPDLANKCVEFRRHPREAAPMSDPSGGTGPLVSSTDGGRNIVLRSDHLTPSAVRMIEDASDETRGDLGAAAAELLNRAAMARRRQLLDWFSENAPSKGTSGAKLVREDRDAR